MNFLKLVSFFLFTVVLFSCASYKDQVIQRMDDLKEKPTWASLSKTTYVKDGKVYAVGFAEASGDAKISALSKIAAHNAKTNLTREIANHVGVVYQMVEEGTEGNELSRYIGTEKSLVLTREIRHEQTYYEKVLTYSSPKDQELKLQLYALVQIPDNVLRKMIKEALDERKDISSELKAKVDRQLDKLLED